MSNPLDDYLGSRPAANEKRAAPFFWPGTLQRAANSLTTGALQSAGAAAGVALTGAALQAYNAINKRREFRSMLDLNEDIKQLHQDNPEEINRFYNSIRRVAPHASDPYVAGHLVRNMTQSAAGPGSVLHNLANEQRSSSSGGLQMGLDLGGQGPRFSFKTK